MHERVMRAANRFIVGQYPFGVMSGYPSRLLLRRQRVWIVPVVLTSPGYGAVGEVGHIILDGKTLRVLGSASRSEVAAATKKLRENKRNEIHAAFLQARTS